MWLQDSDCMLSTIGTAYEMWLWIDIVHSVRASAIGMTAKKAEQ